MGKEGDSSEGTEVLLRLGTIQLGGRARRLERPLGGGSEGRL